MITLKRNGIIKRVASVSKADALCVLGWQRIQSPNQILKEDAVQDYSAMKLEELREAAKDRGIEVKIGAKKADYIEALEGCICHSEMKSEQ